MRPVLAAFALALSCAAAPAIAQIKPPSDHAAGLVSHRAIYDLRLADGSGSKAPASATGRIAYDFAADCGGYAQTLRQVVDMQPNEGDERITETRSTTFEDADGADFRFSTARPASQGGDVDGSAQRDADGISIALSRPEPFRLSTQSDVLFPTQHIERIIEAARRGDKVMLARVYDGSDNGRHIYNVTTIIGKPARGPDADQGAQGPAFRNVARWPVAVAYFPADRRDGLPDYVLSFDLYENGVSTNLRLDYGDFVLRGELTRIEFPPAARCGR
ncbi:cell envelope integrity EipB family protein [Rhodoblastus acidophilus]|uniref:Cell envelope integrity EipB family protein n=1 Tax=Candidatus Rhodoblastus alkanivorans TaxID=2954117 RepID=A0ABS9Z6C7_9HYPH|nr:cell envelope integrity EipB family protein [Candidatus Rhodoblastus alkanivorans]MCI4678392.1 cell envelope integrity EipB family protein [Candidatus Rhodoblastus alkanivorans]MCI4682935.1 cell envelope integrity EipB family protein [Candidatus Rhodoblastus alkanivorans]MDI4640245.1 cell envelope integrity EipB family protein [Rhodoblastus acidophilus]